jgi:RNA polymerase sigma-70 factor (ECF subfamily)
LGAVSGLDHLLPAIAAGDPDAFGRWLAGVEPRLRAGLRSFAAQVDTEAVLQETLLRVWQVAPRFQPDGSPDALFRLGVRIARNLAINELHRSRVAPVETERLIREAEARAEPSTEPDPLLRAAIARCREALPAAPAAAIAQRIAAAGGAADAELALAVGMSLNTFLQNVRRARLALLDCLARKGIFPTEAAP